MQIKAMEIVFTLMGTMSTTHGFQLMTLLQFVIVLDRFSSYVLLTALWMNADFMENRVDVVDTIGSQYDQSEESGLGSFHSR
jgi:hypothetical protein